LEFEMMTIVRTRREITAAERLAGKVAGLVGLDMVITRRKAWLIARREKIATSIKDFDQSVFTGGPGQLIECCKAMALEQAETLAKVGCTDKAAEMFDVARLIAIEQEILLTRQ
jgi:hypothetical protein